MQFKHILPHTATAKKLIRDVCAMLGNVLFYFVYNIFETLLFAGIITPLILWLTMTKILNKGKVQHLHTKYVLITGCDTGFGREIAIRLDKIGVHVLAACLNVDAAHELKSMTSDRLRTFVMDVTDSSQIKDVFEQVKKLLPSGQGLWGLVNNAGLFLIAPFEWTSIGHVKRMADVNIWGMMEVTKTFLPLLKKSQGRIVNMSSMAGRLSIPFESGYCVTKYGVEALSDALRRELSPWGVLVSMIEPGGHKTGIFNEKVFSKNMHDLWDELSPELKKDYGEQYRDKVISQTIKTMSTKPSDPSPVVDAILDALTSLRPHKRYIVGEDAKWLIFLSYLPAFVLDRKFSASVKK